MGKKFTSSVGTKGSPALDPSPLAASANQGVTLTQIFMLSVLPCTGRQQVHKYIGTQREREGSPALDPFLLLATSASQGAALIGKQVRRQAHSHPWQTESAEAALRVFEHVCKCRLWVRRHPHGQKGSLRQEAKAGRFGKTHCFCFRHVPAQRKIRGMKLVHIHVQTKACASC